MPSSAWKKKEAPNKWWALQDRRMRNIANATLYTDKQKIQGERMRLALEILYTGKVYEVTFGKRSLSVKLQSGGIVRDKKALAELEKDWEQLGVFKKQSAQGVQYHLPR